MHAEPTLRQTRAWPFEEAARVADRLAATRKPVAVFETGYGPSGLPHIGTFGEVARTTWVRRAFERLTGLPARLIAFSDDMDGLRKVPDNVPNRDALTPHLGRPLTAIPDPFGTHASFGAHNNARLRAFLDTFGFDYEFVSATDTYRSGRFDAALLRMAERHDAVRDAVLPTLGSDRRATYSPFLPIHPGTGAVLQVPMERVDPDRDELIWQDPATGTRHATRITGGHCKAQWKADWALRWYALGVDYEMSGKDLIDSVTLSSKIVRILGAEPPVGFTYELFLDAAGQKISKSKGNGLTIEEWLRYAPPESLATFMYGQPRRAKRLHFDVIPRAVDDHLANLEKLRATPDPANPAWHVLGGPTNDPGSPVPFAMLLNLAAVIGASTPDVLWGFLRRYAPTLTPESHPLLDRLVGHAIAYTQDHVLPARRHRAPTAVERDALEDLLAVLRTQPADATAEALQDELYAIGKRHPFATLRDWFACLYQVLLGQQEGPRFGGFIALYGIPGTIGLIETALARTPAVPSPDAAPPPAPARTTALAAAPDAA